MKKNTPSASSPLRVAAYCRIASSGEEQNAFLEAQKAYYTEQISTNPDWSMAGIFADTGDCLSKRPEFQKMLCKCRQKKVDLILVKSASRFARNLADCLNIVRELRELGIAVVFEKEAVNTLNPNSDWYISIVDATVRAAGESIPHGICTCRFHHMPVSRRAKGTWKKTIHLPGRPEKTMIFRME